MSGTAYAGPANEDQTRHVIEPSVRGEILDDTGRPMVDNRSALVVSVNMADLAQQRGRRAPRSCTGWRRCSACRTRPLLDKVRLCTARVPQPCWQGSPYQPIPVAQNVSDQVALQVLESQRSSPASPPQVQPVTDYQSSRSPRDTAQVLGYLQPITAQEIKQRGLPVTGFSGVDLVGQAGLERSTTSSCAADRATRRSSVNAAGQVTGTVNQTHAESRRRPGDQHQRPAAGGRGERAGRTAIHKTQAEGNAEATTGAAVVMTTTGRVVAMASYPTYDPNDLDRRHLRQRVPATCSAPLTPSRS